MGVLVRTDVQTIDRIPGEEFLAEEGQPGEGIPEEEPPADKGQPDDGPLAADAEISDTGEQAVADTDDRTDPAEAAESEQGEGPSAEEKDEEPSAEVKDEEPAAEGKPAPDVSQPSAAAGEAVPDSLLAAGEEEVAADDAAGQSQEAPLSITRQPEDVQETVEGTTVTVIGEKAFENNTVIQEIHLPDTIQVIKKRAFAGCSSLASMD